MVAFFVRTRPVRAVLFDLDGTLLDSAPDLGAAVDQMRVSRGLAPLSAEHYRPMVGAGARGMLELAFGVTPQHPTFETLRNEFFANYEARLTQTSRLFEGVQTLFDHLQRVDMPWGIVTNKSSRFTTPITQSIKGLSAAAVVISGDTTSHAKPHPAPLLEAAARIGCPPHECIYIGDDARDIQAGQAAGMGTVAALYGYLGETALHTWGADAEISKPLELLHHLELSPPREIF